MSKSNIIRYSPSYIKEFNESITSILDIDIINNLLEIKNSNRFIKRKSPIKLRYQITDSVANKWRQKKIENENQINPEIFIETLNNNLNKISDLNFKNISINIINYVNENLENDFMYITLNTIFNKCLLEHLYSHLYAELLKMLVKCYGEKFNKLILEKTEDFYNNNISKVFSINTNIDYNKLCEINKEKTKLLGSFILIGCLYKNNIVNFELVLKYCNILFENSLYGEEDKNYLEKYVECLISLLENVGFNLELELGKDRFNLEIMEKVNLIQSNKLRFKPRIRFLVMDLIDLSQNNWKK